MITDSIAHAHTPRPDTGVSNAQLGMWLFLASDAMLMASLVSGHVLLKAGSTSALPLPHTSWTRLLAEAMMLLIAVMSLHPWPGRGAVDRRLLAAGVVGAAAFAVLGIVQMRAHIVAGLTPASQVLIASWFVLTGAHILHVIGGAGAMAWMTAQLDRASTPQFQSRLRAVRMYWYLVVLIWIVRLAFV